MSEADGGSAFPSPGVVLPRGTTQGAYDGMTLRDYFAAQALNGILSGPASREGVPMKEWFDAPEAAYRLADAMLEARKQEPRDDRGPGNYQTDGGQ